MIKLLGACTLVAVMAVASSTNAAERQVGEIPQSQLAALGLSNMEIVPDVQAQNIRGKFVIRNINIKFPATPKGFVNVFIPPLPVPIFFPQRFIGILGR